MLRITLEVIPFGIETWKKHLGTTEIARIRSRRDEKGREVRDYKFTISKSGNPKSVWKEGEVDGFDPKRLGPWDLLLMVLKKALSRRTNKTKIKRGKKEKCQKKDQAKCQKKNQA